MEKVLLNKRAAAEALSVSIRTVDNLLAAREIHAVRIGRRILFRLDDLQRFAKRDHATGRQAR